MTEHTKAIDRWLAFVCAVAWIGYGYLFWIGYWELQPIHLAIACFFCAMHRFYGCTSFLGKRG